MFIPSAQQKVIFSELQKPDCGSIIIEARAGSGKTTTIVEAAKLLSGSLFLGAFNTQMAKELQTKCADIPNVTCATMHSMGRRALVSAKRNVTLNSDKVKDLCIEFLEQYDIDNNLDEAISTKKHAWHFAHIISVAKQRGIGAIMPDNRENWLEMILYHSMDDWFPVEWDYAESLDMVIDTCQKVLHYDINASEEIDFDDMIYLPLLHNLPIQKFDWVMIDEAQDTNVVRRELAKRMLKPTGRLICVGDPHQAIYGFTGASSDAMKVIKEEFRAKVLPLSVSYRCPDQILTIAREYVPDIEAHEMNGIGTVSYRRYDKLIDTVSPGEVILSRFNKYLVDLCIKFIANNTPAKIVGKDIAKQITSLMKKWKTQKFDELLNYINLWEAKELQRAKEMGINRTAHIKDRASCCRVLINRAIQLGFKTKNELIQMVEDMFANSNDIGRNTIILSSVHKAKGMEWDTVYLLGRNEIMGDKNGMSKSKWQLEQEYNLIYVAVTRAKKNLIEVTNIPKYM